MAAGFKKGVSGMAANVDMGKGSKKGQHAGFGEGLGQGKVAKNRANGEGMSNFQFAKGGTTQMFGEQNADTQHDSKRGGGTAHDTGADQNAGRGAMFASGGSTKMHGYAPSLPARAGITSAR